MSLQITDPAPGDTGTIQQVFSGLSAQIELPAVPVGTAHIADPDAAQRFTV